MAAGANKWRRKRAKFAAAERSGAERGKAAKFAGAAAKFGGAQVRVRSSELGGARCVLGAHERERPAAGGRTGASRPLAPVGVNFH